MPLTTNDSIRFLVDGRETSPGLVLIPPMSLSSQRPKMIEHKFRLEIPAGLLCEIGQPAWEDRIALYKQSPGDHSLDEDDWVAQAGYPPLKDIIHDHDELDLMFGQGGSLLDWTLPDILQAHSWQSQHTDSHYYFDRYQVEKVNDLIVWSGSCRR